MQCSSKSALPCSGVLIFDVASRSSLVLDTFELPGFDQALETVPELKQAVESDPQVRKVIDIAKRLEGCARHSSVHAAGVVISPKPLEELIPVAVNNKQEFTTQFEMSDLEKTGMLKRAKQ